MAEQVITMAASIEVEEGKGMVLKPLVEVEYVAEGCLQHQELHHSVKCLYVRF